MKGTITLAALLAAADQALKALIRTHPQGAVLFSVPSILEITHRANTGAAFSLLAGNPLLVTLLSAALLAGLCAEGETVIDGVSHIDRGYEKAEESFRLLGAQVCRLPGGRGEEKQSLL